MSHVLEFFEKTAAAFKDKKAVCFKEDSYTFGELKEKAMKLAKAIEDTCPMHGQPIGVFVNRGADTVVLFLAVLYSGNFYIPLDPEMPIMKVKSILEDSKPQIIIHGDENTQMLSDLAYEGSTLKLTDASDECIVMPEISGDDPIYMVYTSGSTGKPKGVLKSHRAVCSFIKAFTERFELTSEEIIGNQTPFFFDASAKDIYLMLYTGATMEVLPSELFVFPVNLINYMNERKITYACWVPTAFAIVTQLATFKMVLPETLTKAFFVGEVFPIKQLRKWMETLPQIKYVNLYGSTEISGISLVYEIDSSNTQIESLPMGKPMPNCEIFLMNGDELVTEPDVIGEVCVISEALALEYYHDPEKTASVFVEMDMADGRRCRVLRSGDLAKYDEEGNLVFSSRKDFQIKHMGRRIELGEIESVADSLENIDRCCCLYDTKKNKIVLFCLLTKGCDWDSKTIKGQLRLHLSDYMIPSKIVILDEMPYNANGKIDRTSLKERL